MSDLNAARENDRALRAQIDPLIGELSPLGKLELAARLMGEFMAIPFQAARIGQSGTLVLGQRFHSIERDGAAAEAGTTADDADPNTTQPEGNENATQE